MGSYDRLHGSLDAGLEGQVIGAGLTGLLLGDSARLDSGSMEVLVLVLGLHTSPTILLVSVVHELSWLWLLLWLVLLVLRLLWEGLLGGLLAGMVGLPGCDVSSHGRGVTACG